MNNNNFFAGFIIGGLIGAAIALIFAPSKETRTEAQKSVSTGDTHAVSTRYEAPRIVLDEGIHASSPPDSDA